MNTITITVQGEELENLQVELTQLEVAAIYQARKDLTAKVIELEKQLKESQQYKKYAEEARDSARSELDQAHTLLTALGIQDKTNHEESYYRKDLQVSTRIALYIAAHNR